MDKITPADYLVVGAGAMGMAFVDTILTESRKTIVMVDRYAHPGGHWTTAYPFVRLHQPASFYGVNSTRLEHDGIEEFGWNKGLADCSSRDDVCAYFTRVMKKTFLTSGRVQYFPKCDYIGDGKFRSILTGNPTALPRTHASSTQLIAERLCHQCDRLRTRSPATWIL